MPASKFTQSRFVRAGFTEPKFVRSGASGGAAPTSVAFQASAISTAATITAPATINAGDILVLADNAIGTVTPSTVVPTGFTSVVNTNDGIMRQIVSYKIADGTEDGGTITGMNGNQFNAKALLQFRPDTAASSLALSTPNAQVTDANPTAQNVAASGGAVPLIVFAAYCSGGAVSPRTFSPAKDGEVTPDTFLYLAYKIYNSAPANVSVDMDDEGNSNMLQSFYASIA